MDKSIIDEIRSKPMPERVGTMKEMIELAGIACGLNLTVYDGRIGFVDPVSRRIVAIWKPEYSMPPKGEQENEQSVE